MIELEAGYEFTKAQIAELEALRKQNLEQAAQIQMMRAALRTIANLRNLGKIEPEVIAFTALSTTPSQALEAFATKVREQCVERLNIHHFVTGAAYHSTVSAIKGIKELP